MKKYYSYAYVNGKIAAFLGWNFKLLSVETIIVASKSQNVNLMYLK